MYVPIKYTISQYAQFAYFDLKILEIPNWGTVGMEMTDSPTIYNEKDIAKFSHSSSS